MLLENVTASEAHVRLSETYVQVLFTEVPTVDIGEKAMPEKTTSKVGPNL